MFQDIRVEELLELQRKKDLVLIDVRSQSEYQEATIPGSINIPLFDDEERAEVGTIYKQESPAAAKERGLELFSAKLPAFVKAFGNIPQEKVVFCWRGGMRSKTAATVLSLMGIRVYRLEGGFRAYRKWVVDSLESFGPLPEAVVIHGNTGSGKTAILRRLMAEGYPVLDLEALAGHRGSIFGQIGLEARNQKQFDSLLLLQLLELQGAPYMLMEAESKRIGKVVMPEFLVQKKESGIHLYVEMPDEERVRHILDDYQPWDYKEQCIQAFDFIKRRMHTPIAAEIDEHLESGRFGEAVALMLTHYYDPRYEHSDLQYDEDRKVNLPARNVDEAVAALKEWLSRNYSELQDAAIE